ncbi:MAG TPA: DUF748 domain-containing protein [Burkholderiales bacterium]|nr:DUF748 domain-containing protein [Burkholderiales bacterium]
MSLPKLRWPSFDRRRLLRSKLLWSFAAVLVVYTFVGFLLAPYLIERYLPSFAQERLGRRASIEKVRINPYALTFEASGFRLEDKGDKALLAFKRLFVNFEMSSLFARAWRFGEITLESADLGLEIDRNARLNLLEVLRRLFKEPEPDEPTARVLIDRLVVRDTRVGITDLSGELRAEAAFAPINLELDNLSTLPDSEGRYTLNARLPAGGSLAWKGRLSLEPIASAGELSIKGAKLESLWRFRRPGLNLARPDGDLSIAGHYDFRYQEGHATLLLNGMQAQANGLLFALEGEKEPLLALKKVAIEDASFAFPKGELTVKKLVVADGAVNTIVGANRAMNWQRLMDPPNAAPAVPAQPAAAPAAAQPWRIRLLGVAVENVALNYVDQSASPALAIRTGLTAGLNVEVSTGAGPAQFVVGDLEVALEDTAASGPTAATRLAALEGLTIAGGRIDSKQHAIAAKLVELKRGNLALAVGPNGPEGLLKALSAPAPVQPASKEAGEPWRVQVDKVALEKIALQYDDTSRKPGYSARAEELNASFGLNAGAAGSTIATDLQVAIDRVKLAAPGATAPHASLESVRLTGGRIDTAERTATVKNLALSGGGVRLIRGADGRIDLVDALVPKPAQPPARASSGTPASGAWRYRVDSVSLKSFKAALADQSYKPAVAYDLEAASVTASHIDSASRKPIAFTAALRVGKDGTLSGTGTLQQDFAGAGAQVDLARIALEPLEPLLTRHATLDLKSGQLSAKARVAYRRGRQPELTARGEVALSDVLINEAGTNERFASWKTLAVDGADLSLAPDRLAIREVRVIEPGGKIIIAKDRTVNLTKVVKTDASPAPPQQPTSSGAEAPAFPYEIETVRISKGTLDFADLSLVLPFATQVHELDGAIVGISSDPQAKAQIKLAGQVDKYGEARADGTLIPRDTNKFMDITARFNNIDVGSFSPYSATFAGRKIAEGRLSLVLEYKIVNSQLAGENRVVLNNFKLGERVDSPGATNLPLDLAIALLKDSEGRINLDVPVRGNVGDPKFEYSKVIWSAIANVLTRIVTAPFRALAGLFGKGDSDAVRRVGFAPGSDAIAPSQREQLDALAKALKSRPQLKLVVKGPYDSGEDAKALKRRQARLELAGALGAKLQPGEPPGLIAYGNADTQRALERLLALRAGPNALAELEKSYAKRTGREPDRVNPVLGLIGRGSKDTEFYEAVFERLAQAEPLPEGAMQELAARRTRAILDALAKGGIDSGQVSSGGVTQVKADSEKRVVTELALEAL